MQVTRVTSAAAVARRLPTAIGCTLTSRVRAHAATLRAAVAFASNNASSNASADLPKRPRSSLLLVDVAGHTTRCHVFQPGSSESPPAGREGSGSGTAAMTNGDESRTRATSGQEQASKDAGILMLSDIFGCDTMDNLHMCQRLANDLQCLVYMPDLFRGEPWPEETPVTAAEFEDWRFNIGDTWPTDVAAAVAACMAIAGVPRVGLLGFCFGGGRVVDALGHSRTDLLESCAAPPATYSAVRTFAASIDDDDSDCDFAEFGTVPPVQWAYVCGVAFYGTRIDVSALARVRQPLQLTFAGDDALVPADLIQEMRDVRARRPSAGGGEGGHEGAADAVQISVEAGVPHGFVHQAGKQGEAGDRVLARAELFMRKHLLQDQDVFV
eukprot:jgi/Ulvmu1/1684/UM115_0013.1